LSNCKMNSLIVFVCLVGATAALNCTTCGQISYADGFDYAAYNLSTSISEDMPLCSSAVEVTCNATALETACGDATLEYSSTSTTGGVEYTLTYNVTIKGCTEVVTCDELALAAAAEIEDDSTEIIGCSGELCVGGENCVTDTLSEDWDEVDDDDEDDDDSSATTMSLAAVGIFTLARLF